MGWGLIFGGAAVVTGQAAALLGDDGSDGTWMLWLAAIAFLVACLCFLVGGRPQPLARAMNFSRPTPADPVLFPLEAADAAAERCSLGWGPEHTLEDQALLYAALSIAHDLNRIAWSLERMEARVAH